MPRFLLIFVVLQVLSVFSRPDNHTPVDGDSDVNGGAGASANIMNPSGAMPRDSDPSGAAGGISSAGAVGTSSDPMGASGGANPAEATQPM